MAVPLPDQPPHPDVRTPPPSDRAGRVEAHGIDVIPDSERHGRARELFAVWAAPNVSYLSLVVGGALTLTGLTLWQALAVIVVGNLCWAFVGLVAVSGPAAGTPSQVITRAMFGILGNRANIAVTGWFASVCYLALSWAAASLAAFSLVAELGVPVGTGVKVVVIVGIAVLTLAISVLGLRVRRSRSVALDGALGVSLTLYALLVSNFLDTVSSMLELMVVLMGPSMAVYATDILWRRNRYHGPDLADETHGSPFWYAAGVNWAGITALVTGAVAAALCLNTPLFTGPIARVGGGTDLSLPVGILVSAAVYLAMMRSRRPDPAAHDGRR
ncbi:cytosine permease [Streptomyces noursei]|uniref:cytosine permease n=1 Tax=Streptomyces noursei TaxID=1971 RepID=UPI00332AEECF